MAAKCYSSKIEAWSKYLLTLWSCDTYIAKLTWNVPTSWFQTSTANLKCLLCGHGFDSNSENGPYAWLRQMRPLHHQVSFVSKILCICSLCAWQHGVLFITALENFQLYNFKTWLGGEICFFDVNTHKGHWTVGWSGQVGMLGSVLRPA